MDINANSKQGFTQNRLPWIIAAGAMVFYLFTLARWPTFGGLSTLAKVTGWDWHLIYHAPLHFLITYPIRWLPAGWQVTACNLLAVIFSALTLALLARSVALLPYDRTRDQRQLERSDYSCLSIRASWLPAVLAVLVCGLQLTFWENTVVATGESLDLLLFAYVIRCLLEFRIDQRESWLTRMALVYGLAMTNNFAMAAFFPAFLIALFWIKGLGFFNFQFLLRLMLFGLAGLSLYLLLPTILSFSDLDDKSFFEYLRINLGYQKNTILSLPRYLVLLLGFTSLLPILFIGIRWPAQFGDISAVGNALTNVMTHVIHGVFLIACIYVLFDPPFSPRKLGFGWPFLPFYYLGALSIGYFTGYFLLVFGSAPPKTLPHPSRFRLLVNRAVVALIWVALLVVPAGLIYKNLPEIRGNNGPELAEFGVAAAKCLPPEGAVVLSDDPYRLYSLHAALHPSNTRTKYVLVDTMSLPSPAYHRHLGRKYPGIWPAPPGSRSLSEQIDSVTLQQFVFGLSRTNAIYYLHPSFGYYFETFYAKPANLVYQLHPYPSNVVTAPLLTAEEVKKNYEFWKKFKTAELGPLVQILEAHDAKKSSSRYLYPVIIGRIYSRALNYFGVELQKSGDLEKAAEYFASALELNTNNPSAFINLDYNRILRTGQKEISKPSDGVVERLAPYGGSWDNILGLNGPIDEPNSCFLLAEVFARGGNFRQAAQLLLRVLSFNHDDLSIRRDLANVYVQAGFPDKTLELVAAIRAETKAKTLDVADQVGLIQSEAWAYARQNDLATAEKILLAAQEKYPDRPEPFATLYEIYQWRGRGTNAMAMLEKQLKLQPNAIEALINYSGLKIYNKSYEEAIPFLNRSLQLEPQNAAALLNRAIAYLQSGNLDAARRDYEALASALPKPHYAVHYGLGEIAFRKKNRKGALRHYEEYLKLAPASTAEAKLVRERIKAVKSGSF